MTEDWKPLLNGKPLYFAADIYAGLGGWTSGFLAAGFRVVGFDNTRHEYGEHRYPAQLVLQDALTIHGSQLKDASCIVASPPCQAYSYLAMPWSRSKCPLCKGKKRYFAWQLTPDRPPASMDRKTWGPPIPCDCKENSAKAKELRKKWETEGPNNRLFDACFRIQREAIEARKKMLGCTVQTNNKPEAHTDSGWKKTRNGSSRAGIDARIDVQERREIPGRTGQDAPMLGPLESRSQSESGEYGQPCARESKHGQYCEHCYIPLIVENVRGAVPWVGKRDMTLAEWNRLSQAERIERGRPQAQFGSFYLWGDVARIGKRVVAGRDLADIRAGRGRIGMGVAPERAVKGHGSTCFGVQNNGDTYDQRDVNPVSGQKRSGRNFHTYALTGGAVSSPSFHGADHETRGVGLGVKVPSQIHGKEYAMTGAHGQAELGVKVPSEDGGRRTDVGKGARFTSRDCGVEATKQPAGKGDYGSKSNARKQASAMIAKIPYDLSLYIAEQHRTEQ